MVNTILQTTFKILITILLQSTINGDGKKSIKKEIEKQIVSNPLYT